MICHVAYHHSILQCIIVCSSILYYRILFKNFSIPSYYFREKYTDYTAVDYCTLYDAILLILCYNDIALH